MKKIFIYVVIILFTSQFIKAQTGSKSNNKNNIENQGLNNTVENKNSETRGSYWLPAISGRGIYYNLGMVGIGTDNPTTDLDVAGTISTTGLIFPGGNIGDVLTYNSDGSAYWAPSTGGPSLWSVVTQGIVYNPLGLNTYVGIGVASPDEKLHVGGTILTEGGLKMLGNTNQIVFGNEATSTFQIARNLNTRGTSPPPEGAQVSILKVDANNNVGIGTTNPGVKLDVNGTIRTNNDLLVNGNTSINTLQLNSGSCLENFIIDGKTTTNTLQINTGSCQQDYVLTATDINGNTIWKDLNEMNIESAWDEDENGNVFIEDGFLGIGTNNPVSPLTLEFNDGTCGIRFGKNGYSASGTDFEIFTRNENGYNNMVYYRDYYKSRYSWAIANGGIQEKMVLEMDASAQTTTLNLDGTFITNEFKLNSTENVTGFVLQADADGYATWVEQWNTEPDGVLSTQTGVAIGTTTVGTHALAVNGSINAKEILVTETVPGSDYVFEEDYVLMPLSELEKYVNEQKHLPEVMSAKEFVENGYNLGEMDDVLLRKVEELTLYIIQQQKEIDGLKDKLENINK